jgi:hypothetical protein
LVSWIFDTLFLVLVAIKNSKLSSAFCLSLTKNIYVGLLSLLEQAIALENLHTTFTVGDRLLYICKD